MQERPDKTGYLKFNLDSHTGEEAMKNALNADVLKDKIDALYTEVFRPYFKHDNSFIVQSEEDMEFEVYDGKSRIEKHKVSIGLVGSIESAVLEKVWEKVSEHFNG